MIFINEVYKNINNDEYIRIIDIDSEIDVLYFVVCYKKYAYPKPYKLSVFVDEINSKILIRVSDMYQKGINENSLNEKEIQRRDYYWQIVSKYWQDNKEDLLSHRGRAKVFTLISEEHKISDSTVRRIFSRFFERGMNKNSLLTQYSNSGGKGKEKKLNSIKTGRPKKYDYENEKSGINITDDIKIIFQHGIDKFYNNKKMKNLSEVYSEILKEFFSYKYIENGETKYSLLKEDKLPTYGQFYYWYRKNKDETKNIIERQSENEFNLKDRPTLSNSIIETVGPGTRFQIDATVADIYLVSKFDTNRIIGRPVIITIKLIRDTLKKDLKLIQPMLDAIKSNNLKKIAKYDDITIDFEAISNNNFRELELSGKLEYIYKERLANIEIKKNNRIENLSIELKALNICKFLTDKDLISIIKKEVDTNPIDTDYDELKGICIRKAISKNDQMQVKNNGIKVVKIINKNSLLDLYNKAINNSKHPYELLKKDGYIKNPLDELIC